MRSRAAYVPLACCIVLVACSSSPGQSELHQVGDPPSEETSRSKFALYTDVREVDADLSSVYLWLSQDGWHEYDRVYFDCMASAGFDVPVEVRPQRGQVGVSVTSEVTGDLYFEIAAVSEIEADGYGVNPMSRSPGEDDSSDEDIVAADPLSQWINSLSPSERRLYAEADLGPANGEEVVAKVDGFEVRLPAEGCNAVATEARVGDLAEFARIQAAFNELNQKIVVATVADDAYTEATNRWSDCMETRGFKKVDPGELSGPTQEAIADRACRDEVGLRDARREARLSAANRWRDELGDLVVAIADP